MYGTIPGDAPALCDITVTKGAVGPLPWALLAWTTTPGTPASGVAPFGVIEAETGTSLAVWAVTADGDYHGGSGLQHATAGAQNALATFTLNPSVLVPADYAGGDVTVEVWARVELASTLVSPRLRAALSLTNGNRYTTEFGATGRYLVLPSAGTVFRFVRVGTLALAPDLVTAATWPLEILGATAATSTGTFGLDYIMLAVANQRALSSTGKPGETSLPATLITYPYFLTGNVEQTKTVRADLSATAADGSAAHRPAHGLGGSLIELPPGDVAALVKLSSLVPDDPTADGTTEALAHSATVRLSVTPRYHLARSS